MFAFDRTWWAVSISKIRAYAVRVMRGFFTLGWLPLFILLPKIVSTMRDLPRVDLAPLRSPLVWLLVALTIVGALVFRYGTPRMTAPYLWILVLCSVVLVPIGAAFAVAGNVDLTELAQRPVWVWLAAAALLIPFVLLFYWLLLSPTIAALRLLATRVPPDDTSLPTVLASPLPQKDADDAVPPPRNRSPAVVAYRVAAASLGIVAVVLVSWLQASDQLGKMTMALVVLFVAGYVVTKLWRRGRMHAAPSTLTRRSEAIHAGPFSMCAHSGTIRASWRPNGTLWGPSGMAALGIARRTVRSPGSSAGSPLER
jgi:hypothetical protein